MFKALVLDIETASPVFQELVDCAILPGAEGEVSILDFHQSMLVKLKKGVIKIDRKSIPIKEGIAKAANNQLVILAETQAASKQG